MTKRVLFYSLSLPLFFWLTEPSGAQSVYEVNSIGQWETWAFPRDIVVVQPDGSITLKKFEQPINAAFNSPEFRHNLLEGDDAQGGVWKAGTGLTTASNIIDGDSTTYWRPDPEAALDEWWVEINLGRVMPVTKIRLTFPDEEGARPLREFRIFAADGDREPKNKDIFQFHLVGGTTMRNTETVLEFEPSSPFRKIDFRLVDFSVKDKVEFETDFAQIQFVRVIVDAKSQDAALAEVEVFSYGDNVALGTIERGGTIIDKANRAAALADGDVNTLWAVYNPQEGETPEWIWDLGATFWVNRFIMLAEQTSDTWYKPGIYDHRVLGSDGTPKPSGEPDFEILFDFQGDDWSVPEEITYLLAPPRKLRYLHTVFTGLGITGAIAEFLVMPTGYPAQLGMVSGFIQISERAQVLQRLRWDADTPPGTSITAQTRSGNTMTEEFVYHKKSGSVTTKTAWEKLPKPARGRVDTALVVASDWSAWSNAYQFSGQEFLSPSPRRFVQFRISLNSDDPDNAPTLRSLSLDYTEGFLSEVFGQLRPNNAKSGIPQKFTYTLTAQPVQGDGGFNLIRLQTPAQADAEKLVIRVEGVEVDPVSVEVQLYSLVLQLPDVVREQNVEVDFEVSVVKNPYEFIASIGHTDTPELWQATEPSARFATSVFLDGVAENQHLIGNLSVEPVVVTPNGDDIGDKVYIRFSVLKVETPAVVRIYSLNGNLVQELDGNVMPDGLWEYTWSSQDESGNRVVPGNYICRIGVDSQAGNQSLFRVINVAY